MHKLVIIQPESGLLYDWKAIAANPSESHEPQMDLALYKSIYINKIAQARACSQEPVLVSLPIMDENRFFAHITRGMSMQERKNILYWLGGNTARLRNIHALYNLALFRIAACHCLHIIDITSPMLAMPNFNDLLEQDGVSLSEAGHAIVQAALEKVQD